MTGAGQETRPNKLLDNKGDTITDKKTKTSEAEDFVYKKIESLFGYPVRFEPNPVPAMLCLANKYEIKGDFLEKYLEWSFGYLKGKCNNPENFDGYFYKSFAKDSMLQKFCNLYAKAASDGECTSKLIEERCPVCNTEFSASLPYCPKCHFSKSYKNDTKEIALHKKIIKLPDSKRLQLEQEISKLFFAGFGKRHKVSDEEVNEIYKKYGIVI